MKKSIVRITLLVPLAVCTTFIFFADKYSRSSTADLSSDLYAVSTQLRAASIRLVEAPPPSLEDLSELEDLIKQLTDKETSSDLELGELRQNLIDDLVQLEKEIKERPVIINRIKAYDAIDKIDKLINKAYENKKKSEEAWWSYGLPIKAFFLWLGSTGLLILLTLIGVIYLLMQEQVRNWITRNIRKVDLNAFGVTLSIDNLQDDRIGAEYIYKKLTLRVSKQYRLIIKGSNISTKCDGIFSDIRELLKNENFYTDYHKVEELFNSETYRYCLYIPSYIDGDLIQATTYKGNETLFYHAKNQIGRTFSIRYGIIGLAYRLRTIVHNSKVQDKPENLIKEWGLSYFEANRQSSNRLGSDGERVISSSSLVAFPIIKDIQWAEKLENDPVGVFFIDIRGAKANKQLDKLNSHIVFKNLVQKESYKNLFNEIMKLRDRIDFYDKALDQKEGA